MINSKPSTVNIRQWCQRAHGVDWRVTDKEKRLKEAQQVLEETQRPTIKVVLRRPDAVMPSRANETDIGLDLVAVDKSKVFPNGAILYDTGLAVSPPPGHYIEIVPRSSISKTGWVLANSIGTIDPSYTGNLFVALARIAPDAKEPELPFCVCQLILRKAEYAGVQEVFDEDLENTERGAGGFGSTGARSGV